MLMLVAIMQADAAVTRSCIEEGEYGRYRLWGAIGEQRAEGGVWPLPLGYKRSLPSLALPLFPSPQAGAA